jgi:hypothetical protein
LISEVQAYILSYLFFSFLLFFVEILISCNSLMVLDLQLQFLLFRRGAIYLMLFLGYLLFVFINLLLKDKQTHYSGKLWSFHNTMVLCTCDCGSGWSDCTLEGVVHWKTDIFMK